MKNYYNISIRIKKLSMALLLQCRDFFMKYAIRYSLVFSIFDNYSRVIKLKLHIAQSYVLQQNFNKITYLFEKYHTAVTLLLTLENFL